MELNTSIDGTSATITLAGTLTVASSSMLESAFSGLPENVVDITLDLAGLDYVASAGLRVIVSRDKKARLNGGSLRIANPNDEVMEVFDVTGLIDILEIEHSS